MQRISESCTAYYVISLEDGLNSNVTCTLQTAVLVMRGFRFLAFLNIKQTYGK